MKDESTLAPRRRAVAETEIGSAGSSGDGSPTSSATLEWDSSAARPVASRIDGGGKLPLADLASLDPRELAVLAALGC